MEVNDGFEAGEGMLRFEVRVGSEKVEAFLSQATCDALHRPSARAASLTGFYLEHRPWLHETVSRKVGAGARHPVVLMARDLHGPLAGRLQ